MLVSVFTPTYNRADKVHRVWESLLSQTYQDFEWIIVDDGSVDNIQEVVDEYIKIATFNIVFERLPSNKGKHVAMNKAVSLARGFLFLIADSDDAFKPTALDFFVNAWNELPKQKQMSYGGIRVCCEDQHGKRISDVLPISPMDMNMQEAFYRHRFCRESWNIERTDLLKEHPFPDNHVGYFPEGIIWKEISRSHKVRFFNDILRIYYVDDGPSLMKAKQSPYSKVQRNIAVTRDILINDIGFFKFYPSYFLFVGVVMSYYSILSRQFFKQFNSVPLLSKLMMLVTLPASLVYVAKAKLTYGRK